MKRYYLVVSSVTTAQRLQRLLRKRGMEAGMVHTPQNLSEKGCSYSVIVRDCKAALKIAEEAGLAVRNCYEQNKDGTFYQKFF